MTDKLMNAAELFAFVLAGTALISVLAIANTL